MRKFLFVAAVGLMSLTGSVGAAPIEVLPGNPDLAIYLKKPGFQFGDILFDTQKSASFTVSEFNPFGSYTFTGLGSGTQGFAIFATGQYSITKVLLEAIAPEGFTEIKHLSKIQTNTGGCRPGPCDTDITPIPIPPALPLLGVGLVMLCWLGRTRKRRFN